MKRRQFLARFSRLSVLLSLLAIANGAAAAQKPVTLSAQDRADIARVEAYMNALTTVRSGFLQASSRGQVARGTLYISRPGYLRFEYDPPSPLLLVADGARLVYQDNELETTNILGIDDTPLSVLIAKDVKLDDARLEPIEVDRASGLLRVTVRLREEPDAGAVRMVFSQQPLALRQWTVVDAQGIEVRVALMDPEFGVEIDPKVFEVDTTKFDREDRGK